MRTVRNVLTVKVLEVEQISPHSPELWKEPHLRIWSSNSTVLWVSFSRGTVNRRPAKIYNMIWIVKKAQPVKFEFSHEFYAAMVRRHPFETHIGPNGTCGCCWFLHWYQTSWGFPDHTQDSGCGFQPHNCMSAESSSGRTQKPTSFTQISWLVEG